MMTYKMNGRPIEVTASHTYLDIGINNKLSWAEHISTTVFKANKFLGLLCRSLYSSSPFVKETAYRSLVIPNLEYCSSIWDPYHQEYKNKLESVQRRVARYTYGYIHTHIHAYTYIHTYIYMHTYTHMHIGRHMHIIISFKHTCEQIIIIMVIFKCYFSREHIALSYKKWCEHREHLETYRT